MVTIELDQDKTIELNEFYHTLDSKDRTGIHLSDDLHCHMKAYNRIKGLEEVWSRRTKARFNIGNDLHEEFELPFKYKEIEIEYYGATGHPDVAYNDKMKNIVLGPLEFKHTTLHFESPLDLPTEWVNQVKLECVYIGHAFSKVVTVGWLAILEIVGGYGKVYRLTFTKDEIIDASEYHKGFIERLQHCLDTNSPDLMLIKKSECKTCQFNYKDGCPRRPGA